MESFPGSHFRCARRPVGFVAGLTLAVALAALAPAAAATDLERRIAAGDEAWARRAAGRSGLRADPAPIAAAVAAFEQAVELAPESIAARERLLRALYFQGRFASTAERRALVYRRGRDLAEEALAELAAGLESRRPEAVTAALSERPEAAAMFFWAAAHWGLWGEQSGALAAARSGVAARVRERARVAAALDPEYEAAGGLRILGRLHTEAPRIPLVTGWVDREVAVESLERAVAIGPLEPLNRVYLADALLRFRPGRRAEAIALLDAVVAEPPRPDRLMEDEETLALARELLQRAAAGRQARHGSAGRHPQVNRNSMTSPSATR